MRGEPRPEEAGDQKKWRCLGDYLLEDFEGKVVVDGSLLLATILWWRTGPEAVLKVTWRTGASELGIADIASSTILD